MLKWRDIDPVIFFCAVGLSAFGMVMVYSASNILALDRYNDSLYFVKRHVLWMLIGFAVLLFFTKLDSRILSNLAYPALVISIVALALVFVPGIGRPAGGARRWVSFGPLSFQPAEVAKLGLVLFLAHFLTVKGERLSNFKYGFLPPILLTGFVLSLILIQPDLGTAMLIAATAGMLFFLAGAKWVHLAGFAMTCVPIMYWMVFSTPWRQKRVLAFLHPFDEARGAGYQLIQSLLALGRGGVVGLGLGEGKQKLFYLPEPHTDFIYAVVGEELGLIGALAVGAVFFIILSRGLVIAHRCKDPFGALLAAGVTLLVVIQGLLNMAVATGLVPTTGLPLPLVSLGGTSIVVTLAAIGMLLSVASKSGAHAEETASTPMDAAFGTPGGRIKKFGWRGK